MRAPMTATRSCARSVFLDVAFDEGGDLLYAWSMGGLHGALLCWRMVMLSTGNLGFQQLFVSFYEPDTNQRTYHNNLLKLYPFTRDDTPGCVVGASSDALFFACSQATSFPNQEAAAPISAISCPQLKTVEVRACCIGNNGSFITLQRSWGPFRDFRIRWGCLPGKHEYTFGSSQEGGIKTRRQGDSKQGLQIGIFGYGDQLVVGIFYLNGMCEYLKL